jgi:hypothetical protein
MVTMDDSYLFPSESFGICRKGACHWMLLGGRGVGGVFHKLSLIPIVFIWLICRLPKSPNFTALPCGATRGMSRWVVISVTDGADGKPRLLDDFDWKAGIGW